LFGCDSNSYLRYTFKVDLSKIISIECFRQALSFHRYHMKVFRLHETRDMKNPSFLQTDVGLSLTNRICLIAGLYDGFFLSFCGRDALQLIIKQTHSFLNNLYIVVSGNSTLYGVRLAIIFSELGFYFYNYLTILLLCVANSKIFYYCQARLYIALAR